MKRTLCLFILWAILTPQFLAGKELSGKSITIHVKQGQLKDVLCLIEEQTSMTFSYEASLLRIIPPVTFTADKEDLEGVLQRLFHPLSITYSINGNFIILKKKATSVTISGFVSNLNDLETLPGASVVEKQSRKGVATDKNGYFHLELPDRENVVEISYIGYKTYRTTINTAGKDTVLYIFLEEATVMQDVVVTARKDINDVVQSSSMGAIRMGQATIKNIPTLMGEADIVKTLQTLPGVSPGIEGMAGMYVRGGNHDENLYIFDNQPLYNVNHLGGFFSAFNPEFIREIDFYKAAFPARYGGRLSSVIDIRSVDGDMREYHGSATLGLTSGNLNFRGPLIKDKTTFNISLRRSWLDVLSAPALAIVNKKLKKDGDKSIARYAFTDLNAKINHFFTPSSTGYFSVYWGDDFMKWGSESFPAEDYKDKVDFLSKDVSRLRWGNLLVTSGWTKKINPRTTSDISLSYTHYQSKLQNSYYYSSNKPGTENFFEEEAITKTKNGIRDIGFKSRFEYFPAEKHIIRFGTDFTFHSFTPESFKVRSLGDILSSENVTIDSTVKAHELNLYAEDDWSITDDLKVNAGIRFNLYKVTGKSYFTAEPRVSARYLISRPVSIKASYARMVQHVHQVSESYINLPTDMWLPVSKNFRPMESDQVSAGVYYSPNPAYSFSVEGYYKWMNNILDYRDGFNTLPNYADWEKKLAAGKGTSYGVELIARKDEGKLTGWLGYGLMWADRQFDEINNGEKYRPKFDNRHKINLVGNYKLTKNLELTASWTYMTGNRLTLSLEDYSSIGLGDDIRAGSFYYNFADLEYVEGRNNIRLADYHRLDLGINIYRPKKSGNMGIWNISIYNVYSRFNPITIQREYKYVPDPSSDWREKAIPVFKTFGFMPIIPSISYTYKF